MSYAAASFISVFRARASGSCSACDLFLRFRVLPELTSFRAADRSSQLTSSTSAYEAASFTPVFMRGPAVAPQLPSFTFAYELSFSVELCLSRRGHALYRSFLARASGSSSATELFSRLRSVPQFTIFSARGRAAQLTIFPSAYDVTRFAFGCTRGPVAVPQLSRFTSAYDLYLSSQALERAIAPLSVQSSPGLTR